MGYKPKKNSIQTLSTSRSKHHISKKPKKGHTDRRCKVIHGFYFFSNTKA